MTEFTAGQEVFLESGRAAEYVAHVPGEGHLIRPLFGDEDTGDTWAGKATTVERVFAKAPVEKWDEKVAALQAQEAAERQKLADARQVFAAFERDERARRDRLAVHDALEALDRVLSGQVTHIVVLEWYGGVRVQPVEGQVESKYSSDLQTLTLSGRLEQSTGGGPRKARWGFNDTNDIVAFCLSEEEAREKAKSIIAECIGVLLAGKATRVRGQHLDRPKVMQAARAYGVDLPAEWVVEERAKAVATAEEEVSKHEKVLAEKRAALARAKGGAPA